MSAAKIAITIDEDLVKRIDLLVQQKAFPNRSKAIQEAVEEKLKKIDRGRLVRECNKLDPAYEQALAEEGLSVEVDEWPKY
jgi:Arc/MetJ-type ribon-helix-helix transcriptional regulator